MKELNYRTGEVIDSYYKEEINKINLFNKTVSFKLYDSEGHQTKQLDFNKESIEELKEFILAFELINRLKEVPAK